MRNWLLLLALVVVAFAQWSCEKDEPADDLALIQEIAFAPMPTAIAPADLPAAAQHTLEELFFETFAEDVFRVDGRGYVAHLGNDEILYFNQRGALLEFSGDHDRLGPFGDQHPHGPCYRLFRSFGRVLPVDSLPGPIQTYVSDNYPDQNIVRAKRRGDMILILVRPHTVLVFDLDGNFIEERNLLFACHRPCRDLGDDATADAVTDYVETNFPEATVQRTCRRIGRVHVLLLTPEGRVVLVFDGDGNFLFQRP